MKTISLTKLVDLATSICLYVRELAKTSIDVIFDAHTFLPKKLIVGTAYMGPV